MSDSLFDSERIYIRHFALSDLASFHDMQSNPNVMKFVGQQPMSESESEANLRKVMDHASNPTDGFRVWGAFLKETDEMIGTCAIISSTADHEIGYRLREIFWGNGLGFELANAVLKYAFNSLKIELIFAEVDQRNTASIKILDKTMYRIRAFWNESSQTNDYYYELSKANYEKI
jgi:RimJ/RimL family protein N-acetyltransferase